MAMREVRVLVLAPDGSFEDRRVSRDDLAGWQALVGGPIELVALAEHGAVAVVNEDAGLTGEPFNVRASALCGVLGRPVSLCGPVVFAGAGVREAMVGDLAQEVFDVFAGLTWLV